MSYYSREQFKEEHPDIRGIEDEDELLALLESERGLFISGPGGTGKTRLMFELGKKAYEDGWAVFEMGFSTEARDVEDLSCRFRPGGKYLFLFDYLETKESYQKIIEGLYSITGGSEDVFFIGNFRSSFKESIRGETYTVSLDEGESVFEYRKAVVRHVLQKTGLTECYGSDLESACHSVPMLSVFIYFLSEQKKGGDLDSIRGVDGFKGWLTNRIEATFAKTPNSSGSGKILREQVALILSMFPCSDDAKVALDRKYPYIMESLVSDLWLEFREISDSEEGEGQWSVIHDVLTDAVLSNVFDARKNTSGALLGSIIDEAIEFNFLEVCLRSLERICDNSGLKHAGTMSVIERSIETNPAIWGRTGSLVLNSPLLSLKDRLTLFFEGKDVWKNAFSGVEFANAAANFLLQIFRLKKKQPDEFAELSRNLGALKYVLDSWLRRNGGKQEAYYVIYSLLTVLRSPESIRRFISCWLDIHGGKPEARFVISGWLNGGGDDDFILPYVSCWINKHGQSYYATNLIVLWLTHSGKHRWILFEHIRSWLDKHGHSLAAYPMLGFLLTHADGGPIVRKYVGPWFEGYGHRVEAGSLLSRCLEARFDSDLTNFYLESWLEIHGRTMEARPILERCLDRMDFTDQDGFVKLWLDDYGCNYEAYTILCRCLEHNVNIDLGAYVDDWLKLYGKELNARVLFSGCLEHRIEIDIHKPIDLWLNMHGKTLAARQVLAVCARMDVENIVDKYIDGWLVKNGEHRKAAHLLNICFLKGMGGEIDEYVRKWLVVYGLSSMSFSLVFSWVSKNGADELIREYVLYWIDKKPIDAKCLRLLRCWTQALDDQGEAHRIWAFYLRKNNYRNWFAHEISHWLFYTDEPVKAKDYVEKWLKQNESGIESGQVLITLLAIGDCRQSVKKCFECWLDTYAEDLGAMAALNTWVCKGHSVPGVDRYVFAWLDLWRGDLSALNLLVSFLNSGREPFLLQEYVAFWLKIHGDYKKANVLIEAWRENGGYPAVLADYV
ncbi:hypothetical protein [Desulfovibrio sp. JC022]|uniref:hypothetical protein n=1 Tax=Desulfovibrio sp. JC022 TaxID=2593642 RepID=UPI0013D4CD7D|nr:hypothetical protein [Desulfovibrio sp. JC022]NDV23197.1 hypothetical protein [Desulfovibrio sp. JC022]